MHRLPFHFSLSILLCIFLFSSCKREFVVSGRVYDPETNIGISDVVVSVGSSAGTTNAEGKYQMKMNRRSGKGQMASLTYLNSALQLVSPNEIYLGKPQNYTDVDFKVLKLLPVSVNLTDTNQPSQEVYTQVDVVIYSNYSFNGNVGINVRRGLTTNGDGTFSGNIYSGWNYASCVFSNSLNQQKVHLDSFYMDPNNAGISAIWDINY